MHGFVRSLGAVAVLLALGACTVNYGRQSALVTNAGEALSANAGDTVMDTRILRGGFSALALVDHGGSEYGRVLVRFMGAQGGKAVLVRNDLVMNSDGSPLWVPVGVSSPASDYAAAAQPITLLLGPGEYLPLEGRRLVIRRVSRDTLEYAVEAIQPDRR